MIVEIVDGNKTWVFSTKTGGDLEKLYSFFEAVEEQQRSFEKIEIEFEEDSFLEDMEAIFTQNDKNDKIKKQVVYLKKIETEEN